MRIRTKTLTAAIAAGLMVGTLAGANASEVQAGSLDTTPASTPIISTVLRAPTRWAPAPQTSVHAALTAAYDATPTLTAVLFQNSSTIEGDSESPEEAVITDDEKAELERRVKEMPTISDLGWSETKGEKAVEFARQYIGFPYVWGGNGPIGYDCSGFTKHVFAQFGIDLPRYSEDQVNAGPHVPASEAKPGDLMWWPGHVGIYTGNGNHIAARNPTVGIQEGPVYGDPVYVRLLPYDPTEDDADAEADANKSEETAKPTPSPTPTPATTTPAASPSPTSSASPTPSASPSPTASASPSPTASASPTDGSTTKPGDSTSATPDSTPSPSTQTGSPDPSSSSKSRP